MLPEHLYRPQDFPRAGWQLHGARRHVRLSGTSDFRIRTSNGMDGNLLPPAWLFHCAGVRRGNRQQSVCAGGVSLLEEISVLLARATAARGARTEKGRAFGEGV